MDSGERFARTTVRHATARRQAFAPASPHSSRVSPAAGRAEGGVRDVRTTERTENPGRRFGHTRTRSMCRTFRARTVLMAGR